MPSSSSIKSRTTAAAAAETSETQSTTTTQQPTAYLELKTYDPASGVCLKYKTDKAAEVGRLVASLGTLGRDMAALPEQPADGMRCTAFPRLSSCFCCYVCFACFSCFACVPPP